MLLTSTRHWSRVLKTTFPRPPTRFLTCSSRNAFYRTVKTSLGRSFPSIPSFKEELVRSSGVKLFSEHLKPPSIRNQIIVFVVGSGLAFSFAAAMTNDDTDYWVRKLTGMSLVWKDRLPTNDEILRTRYYDLAKRLQKKLGDLKDQTADLPLFLRGLVVNIYVNVAQPYLDSSDGKRTCWNICLVNAAIWVAWHIPRLQTLMNVRFTHHPLSGLSYTLLTSVFSHKNVFHLILNCMALTSFGTAASYYLSQNLMRNSPETRESTPRYHFMAFFVSAGMFSSLVSHIVSVKFRYPRLIAQLASPATLAKTASSTTSTGTSKTIRDILPSLGASGAVYATVVLTALGFPDTEIALIIPPSTPIPIQWGVGGLVAIDMLGAIRGWRFMDHWAHLGGAAFGAIYYAYGTQFWSLMRSWQPPKPDARRQTP